MKPRSCRVLRKSDLNAVICRHAQKFLVYCFGRNLRVFGRNPIAARHLALWHYKMCPSGTRSACWRGCLKGADPMMLTALGLMSGTSLDGVDVALIETDGKQVKAF